jgi:hypothetical protein
VTVSSAHKTNMECSSVFGSQCSPCVYSCGIRQPTHNLPWRRVVPRVEPVVALSLLQRTAGCLHVLDIPPYLHLTGGRR